ncbi:MAG: LTA synthase family protein [Eubacteriales bacterium]|nr:LTA synthase family protein [Eubacteriales bacterium]
MLPLDKIQEDIRRRRSRRKGTPSEFDLHRTILRTMFFLTPFYVYYMIAKVADTKTVSAITFLFTFRGVLNVFIIGMIWWLVYTICNRTNIAIVITTFLGFAFGMANYLLILFRDSPQIFTDIASAGTAADVIQSYRVTFTKYSLWLIMLTVVWMIMALIPRGNKGLSLKKRLAVLLAACVWVGVFHYTFFTSDIIEDHNIKVSGFKPKFSYKKNGYALLFAVTIKTSFIEKPDDYSPEAVDKIMSGYESDKAKGKLKVSEKNPNVIVIMNEAFSDLNTIGPVSTNKDFMPYLHSLKENTIKGTMHTSIFGGSTADTEFEFLTGNTMEFLPFHSVPYNNMVKDNKPSLTWNLLQDGYAGGISFHPGMKDSYNRANTYPKLGFKEFVYYDKLKEPEKIRDYVSDSCDFRYIRKRYEQYETTGNTAPWYLFNVTIQNHSGFKLATGKVESGIRITDNAQMQEEAQQYLNLVKKSDDAYKELFEYFKTVDEPTVIITFGDHQPRVENEFYDVLMTGRKDQSSLERGESKYQVPFFIWANYDIGSKDGVQISANYLHAYAMQQIGGPMTAYDKYLMNLRKELPSITAIAYMDKDHNMYDSDAKSKYSKLLNDYQKVQYNSLVDYKNRLNKYFFLQK